MVSTYDIVHVSAWNSCQHGLEFITCTWHQEKKKANMAHQHKQLALNNQYVDEVIEHWKYMYLQSFINTLVFQEHDFVSYCWFSMHVNLITPTFDNSHLVALSILHYIMLRKSPLNYHRCYYPKVRWPKSPLRIVFCYQCAFRGIDVSWLFIYVISYCKSLQHLQEEKFILSLLLS